MTQLYKEHLNEEPRCPISKSKEEDESFKERGHMVKTASANLIATQTIGVHIAIERLGIHKGNPKARAVTVKDKLANHQTTQYNLLLNCLLLSQRCQDFV